MPQTLFALVAVLAFSLYALGRHRSDNGVEQRAVVAQLERAAADLAEARMADLLNFAWDEEDIDRTQLRRTPPTSGIGPDSSEAPGSYDDIDDFDGVTETGTASVGGGSAVFTVRIGVSYARETAGGVETTGTATLAKQVVVAVEEAAPTGRRPVEATLRRVVVPRIHSPSE